MGLRIGKEDALFPPDEALRHTETIPTGVVPLSQSGRTWETHPLYDWAKGTEERLDRRIVVAIALAVQADPPLSQQPLVGPTGLLTPAIRLVQQTHCWLPTTQGHAQGLFHEGLIPMRSHGPTQPSARKRIEDDRKARAPSAVQTPVMAVTHLVVGADATLISPEQIVGDGVSMPTVGGDRAMGPPTRREAELRTPLVEWHEVLSSSDASNQEALLLDRNVWPLLNRTVVGREELARVASPPSGVDRQIKRAWTQEKNALEVSAKEPPGLLRAERAAHNAELQLRCSTG